MIGFNKYLILFWCVIVFVGGDCLWVGILIGL